MNYNYHATFTPDDDDGGYVVTFREFPEAMTQGDSLEEAKDAAADCLATAVAYRIKDMEDIPAPARRRQKGEVAIPLDPQIAIKAAVYTAWKEAKITRVAFAERLGTNEKEARRILDPRHGTKLTSMVRALNLFGKHLEVNVV